MAGPFDSNITRIAAKDGKIIAQPKRTIYDIVKLGDYTLPGISRISSIKRTRKIHTEKKKQDNGARVVDAGIDLARIEIENRVFTEEEIDDMALIVDLFDNRLGLNQSTKSYDIKTGKDFGLQTTETPGIPIYHPATRERGIFYVYIDSIEGPNYVQPPGYVQYKINLVEVMAPKKVGPSTVAQKELNLSGQQAALDVSEQLPPIKDPKLVNP